MVESERLTSRGSLKGRGILERRRRKGLAAREEGLVLVVGEGSSEYSVCLCGAELLYTKGLAGAA